MSVRAAGELLAGYDAGDGPIDYLGIIEDAEKFPSDEARKALARLLESHPFRRVALVFPQRGFKASIVRSIVSAMGLMSRKTTAQKVFDELGPAVEHLVDGGAGPRAQAFAQSARELSKLDL